MSAAIDALTNSLDNFVQQYPNWAYYINRVKANYSTLTINQMLELNCGGCLQLENFRDFFILMKYHGQAPQGIEYAERLTDIFTNLVLTLPLNIEPVIFPFIENLFLDAIGKEINNVKKLHELKSWINLYSKLFEFSKNNQSKVDLTKLKENLELQISYRIWDIIGIDLEESKLGEILEAIDFLAYAEKVDINIDSNGSDFLSFIFRSLYSKYHIYFVTEQENQVVSIDFGKSIVSRLKTLRLDDQNQEELKKLEEFFISDIEFLGHNLPYTQLDFKGYIHKKIVYASTSNPKVHVTIDHYSVNDQYDAAVKTYTANQTIDDLVKVKLEIDILETLSNISTAQNCFLKFYGSSWSGLSVYLSMEYHPQTLMQYISELKQNNKKFTEQHLIFYTRQLCEGFLAMEQLGIFHQDIKPHNILVTEQFYLKIIDFSISCVRTQADATIAATGVHLIQGTSGYMAPELEDNLRNPSLTAKFRKSKADVFSLGMTLLQLCTFDELYTLNLKENNGRLMEKIRGLNVEWFKTLLSKMLCLNYNDRISFQSALSFIPGDRTTLLHS